MKVYLDLCCFNRPFDDQRQYIVYLETEAKMFIQRMIADKEIQMAWSYMLDFENSANPDYGVRDSIARWKALAETIILENQSILDDAEMLHETTGLGIKDSIHIVCAVESQADFFITTDKGILKKKNALQGIQIVNPIEFIQIKES